MTSLKPTFDPYRVLGVARGATQAQVKAAHRSLAKRYHPDGGSGDEIRFLAVQEAYQLLSDPVRRRAWDQAHAPGPVRQANDRPRPGGDPPAGGVRGRTRVRRSRRPRGAGTHTWSAAHVPWWEDFQPGARQRDRDPAPAEAIDDEANEFDVFDRSSGAAWSAAARRHFRRGTDDLPSRGVWRYRGTQVVTGAEARQAAEEEEEERSRR